MIFWNQAIQPWYANLGKQVTKAHKFYIRDSGIPYPQN